MTISRRPLDVEDDLVAIIREMTKINVAVKAWRSPVTDCLNDNRCFNSTADAGEKWMPMVKALFDTDKTALAELLSISFPSSYPYMLRIDILAKAKLLQWPRQTSSQTVNTRCCCVR